MSGIRLVPDGESKENWTHDEIAQVIACRLGIPEADVGVHRVDTDPDLNGVYVTVEFFAPRVG